MSTMETEHRTTVIEGDGTPEGDERATRGRWQTLAQITRWLERPLQHEHELAEAGYQVVTRDKERGASVDPLALEIARDDVATAKHEAARAAQSATARANEARAVATRAELDQLSSEHGEASAAYVAAREQAEAACATYLARLIELGRADARELLIAARVGRLTDVGTAPSRPSRTFFGQPMRFPRNNPFARDFAPLIRGRLRSDFSGRQAVERELEDTR